MTKEEIIAFLRTNTTSYLATTENGGPRVRGMMHFITEDGSIIYHTGANKDLGAQMPDGAPIELCAFDPNTMTQVRVNGKVQRTKDQSIADALLADRPFLQQMIDAIGIDMFLMVKVANPKATVWTMETNFAPKEWVEI